ncbi:type IV secretory system conjugative DNA transfer family protein [Kitasatospora sp. P5_F3]
MLTAALLVLVFGFGALAILLGGRLAKAHRWQRSLVALSVRFPRGLGHEEITAWLSGLGSLRVPVGLEIVSTPMGITHYLLVPEADRAAVLARTQALLPRLRLVEAADYQPAKAYQQAATELRLTNLSRPLAVDRAATTSAALLAALNTVRSGEAIRVQYLLTGLPTPHPRPNTDPAAELRQAEKIKHRQPLVGLSVRLGAMAHTPGRAHTLLGAVTATFRMLDAPGVSLRRRMLPSRVVGGRLAARALPVAAWPVVVNVDEAGGLLGLPHGQVQLPGLSVGRARQLPAGAVPSGGGSVLADSNYPGVLPRPLAIRFEDRLRHLYAVGPTGVGKSTLIANLAVADAAAGYGLFLIDPKGDLVEDILARLPHEAADRVVVLDPSETAQPIGFNPLAVAPGAPEHVRELVADQVLHIFRDLYRAFWGPRTDDILRAALLTLVSVPAPNGSAFTLAEVSELLTNPALRRYAAAHPGLPQVLRDYWRWFDGMSEGERLQHIGPVNNKLRAFTMRTPTRLMLGQSQGLDLAAAIRQRKIVLVSLAKGKLGTETSQLVGSLLVSAFWQAALGRVATPADQRQPYFLYLDEFQDVVRLSDGLADLLSQARGLGVGAVLANQYLAQLPDSIRTAVLGTVRSQVVFQVEYDDARLLERRFAPALSADDLMGLDAHEVALRATVHGETVAPVTGRTRRLAEPIREAAELARLSQQRFGRNRADVEADLTARIHLSAPGRLGRRQHSNEEVTP